MPKLWLSSPVGARFNDNEGRRARNKSLAPAAARRPGDEQIHIAPLGLAAVVGQLVSATSTQGRFPAVKLDGHRLTGMDAYGEHLLIDAGNGDSVPVHLGMRGENGPLRTGDGPDSPGEAAPGGA